MATPPGPHRGAKFLAFAFRLQDRLGANFKTKGPVVIYPASGSDGLEAALVNVLSPGARAAAGGTRALLWGVARHRAPHRLDVDCLESECKVPGAIKAILLLVRG